MESKDIVLGFFKAAANRDVNATIKFLSPDIIWEDNGPPEMIGGGKFTNADEVIDYIWNNINNTCDLVITPEWILAEGNKVVVLINERAQIIKTGRFYEINSIHIYTVKNDTIVHFINYFDPTPILKAQYNIDFSPGTIELNN